MRTFLPLAAALALLVSAAPAAAQAPPPDERAAARAFADAAARFDGSLRDLEEELNESFEGVPSECSRLPSRIPGRRQSGASALVERWQTRTIAAILKPAPRSTITPARRELAAFAALPGPGFDRKVEAASRRLQALGVPRAKAELFAAPGE